MRAEPPMRFLPRIQRVIALGLVAACVSPTASLASQPVATAWR